MPERLGYLGPAGTFTEEAALRYAPSAKLISFSSIGAVGEAVSSEKIEEGIVPIENSLEGSVNDTLDLLIHNPRILIWKEIVLPIEHYLLVKPGTILEEVKKVFSHPQALAQCRRFVENKLSRADLVATFSTAAAVEQILSHPLPAGAIAPKRAAQLYGAQIIAENIQDHASNATRFIVLSLKDHPPTGKDKTSICFTFAEDKPGQLYSVLKEFAEHNINLAKVESRPLKESLGKYYFLTDLEGHRGDPIISGVLERVKAKTSSLKIFGSYPKYQKNS